jgi:hypothetical protein
LDYKGLIHLLNQKNLSGRQAHWMKKLGKFNFKIKYIPGEENVLSDALLHIYSNDSPGTVRAQSEYTVHDDSVDNSHLSLHVISMPLLSGQEAKNKQFPWQSDADTGHPESSKEFAARMKNCISILGPKCDQEGKNSQNSPPQVTEGSNKSFNQSNLNILKPSARNNESQASDKGKKKTYHLSATIEEDGVCG